MTDLTPDRVPEIRARAELRQQLAAAIHRYDNEHALSGNDVPSEHHFGEADAVLPMLDAAVAAAVRHALEEAADVLEANAEEWDGWPDKQRVMRKDADWLRTRTAAASPVSEQDVCVHPEGYEGECPCPPVCSCCAATAATTPACEPGKEATR